MPLPHTTPHISGTYLQHMAWSSRNISSFCKVCWKYYLICCFWYFENTLLEYFILLFSRHFVCCFQNTLKSKYFALHFHNQHHNFNPTRKPSWRKGYTRQRRHLANAFKVGQRKFRTKFELIAVQGHSRSSTLVPIKSACNFLLVVNSNFGLISHRFRVHKGWT